MVESTGPTHVIGVIGVIGALGFVPAPDQEPGALRSVRTRGQLHRQAVWILKVDSIGLEAGDQRTGPPETLGFGEIWNGLCGLQ